MRHHLPCNMTANSEDVSRMYLESRWKLQGLPETMVSDRGTQFTSKFWRTLYHHLPIERRLSSAFHPQTKGQNKRVNAVMELYLRSNVSNQQEEWSESLPMAEFAAKNAISESTTGSPFFANYGFNPGLNWKHDSKPNKDKHQDASMFANTMEKSTTSYERKWPEHRQSKLTT